jgi:hypothetical protein
VCVGGGWVGEWGRQEEEDERRPQKKAAKKARFNLVDDMAEVDEEVRARPSHPTRTAQRW